MLPRPQKLWRKHFPSGCWSRAPRRAEILYRAAQTLQERKENLAQDMTREMGKVLLEVRGDMQEGIDMAYYMAGEGRRLPDGDRACEFFIEPTVFAGVAPQMRIAQEEIFGPVVSVIPCDGLESAIEIGNGISWGLSSAIYTQDVNKAFAAVRDMYTGIFYVNSSTVGAEIHLPFGAPTGPATGTGRLEWPRWIPFRSGNLFTGTTAGSCNGPRLTPD